MKIVYNNPKWLSNIDKHGMDFLDLEDGTFFANSVVVPARDGRYKALGWLNGQPVLVVFEWLGKEAISIISMRRASRKERGLSSMTRRLLREFEPGRGYTKDDWDEVSDTPELTDEEIRSARPFAEAFPDLVASIPKTETQGSDRRFKAEAKR